MRRRHLRQLQEWLEEEGLKQVLHRMASSCVLLPSWGLLGLLPTRKSRAERAPSLSTALLDIPIFINK